jgi:aryl-alcohol dehydrogenase-like predicted oxidoreductase
MQHKTLGRTGLAVSAIGFGCGAVGGLMTRGSEADQERAVARAIDLGITYFDTAPAYGGGASETNLGRVLRKLRPDIVVGTKFHAPASGPVQEAVAASLDASLHRLGLERVDLFQMHNPIGTDHREAVSAERVIDEVIPALLRLRESGKFGFAGFTAIGATAALQEVFSAKGLATAQVAFNALNPSAGRVVPAGFPGQDYGGLLTQAADAGIGTIGIRVLAGGALSGSATRHRLGAPVVEPIGSGPDYATDVRRAAALRAVADEAGIGDLIELAIRFAISHPALSTAMVGLANLEQLEIAAAAAARGPLPAETLARLAAVQDEFQ